MQGTRAADVEARQRGAEAPEESAEKHCQGSAGGNDGNQLYGSHRRIGGNPQRYAGACLQEQQTGEDKRPKGRPGTGHQGHPTDIQTGQGSVFTTTEDTGIKTTLIWRQET